MSLTAFGRMSLLTAYVGATARMIRQRKRATEPDCGHLGEPYHNHSLSPCLTPTMGYGSHPAMHPPLLPLQLPPLCHPQTIYDYDRICIKQLFCRAESFYASDPAHIRCLSRKMDVLTATVYDSTQRHGLWSLVKVLSLGFTYGDFYFYGTS